jgi:hypothetical protein
MSLNLLLNQPFVSVGLPTWAYTVGTAGIYSVLIQSTELPPSGVSIVINNNGSPVFTAPTLSATQGSIQFKYMQLFAASDAITVVMSSATASDALLNTVQSTCSIQQGA